MTRRWPGIVVAMLCLLAVATSASAESWVLWVVQGTTVDHRFASYTSAKECIRELDSREQFLRPDSTLLMTRIAATSLNVTDKTKASSTTYECLPDTVDPRGPKVRP